MTDPTDILMRRRVLVVAWVLYALTYAAFGAVRSWVGGWILLGRRVGIGLLLGEPGGVRLLPYPVPALDVCLLSHPLDPRIAAARRAAIYVGR